MNLTNLRVQNKKSQAEIARALNLNRVTYNNYETKKAIPPLDTLIKIADYYNVTVEDFLSPARSQKISAPRHIVVYAIRELLGASFEAIADFLCKKHTTMLYSYEKIRDELKTNRDLKRGVQEIIESLRG